LLDKTSHTSATIVGVVFGIELEFGDDNWYVTIAEDILGGVAQAGIPGQFLVDLLPIRKFRSCKSPFKA
jgi:hypothetical protein